MGRAYFHRGDGVRFLFRRTASPRCIAHTLVSDVVPLAYPRPERPEGKLFTALSDEEIEHHINYQARKVQEITRRHRLEVLHANHVLLMPYVVTIHGSTIEYVLEKDERYRSYAVQGLGGAGKIIVLNRDVRERVLAICLDAEARSVEVPVGVDTGLFRPVSPSARERSIAALLEEAQRVGHSGKSREMQNLTCSLPDLGLAEEALFARLREIRASYTSNYPDEDLREKLGFIDWSKEKVVIYFGQLSLEKGVHCLIAAMPEILARSPEVRLFIVGDGISRELLELFAAALDRGDVELARRVLAAADGEFAEPVLSFFDALDLEDYRRKAREADLRRAIVFTGYLTRRELARLLPCAELSVIPSLVWEAFPLVFVESLACGVLPVAPRFGGLASALDELAGGLCPIGETAEVRHGEGMVHDLAERIPALLSRLGEEAVKEKVSHLCRELTVRKYDWKSVISRIEALYAGACDGGFSSCS